MSLIPGLERSLGEGNGSPLQYFCLGNPLDRGAWWATVHGVAKESDWATRQLSSTDLFPLGVKLREGWGGGNYAWKCISLKTYYLNINLTIWKESDCLFWGIRKCPFCLVRECVVMVSKVDYSARLPEWQIPPLPLTMFVTLGKF